jgi:hypothetical protein
MHAWRNCRNRDIYDECGGANSGAKGHDWLFSCMADFLALMFPAAELNACELKDGCVGGVQVQAPPHALNV